MSGGFATLRRRLAWVDRSGREEPLPAPERAYRLPRISPDGTRVAIEIDDQEDDIWTWDFGRQSLTRLTFSPEPDGYPVWSPDSRRVIFASAARGPVNLFWQASDGSGAVERLTESPDVQAPTAMTPDGRHVIFQSPSSGGQGQDIFMMPLLPPQRAEPLAQTMSNERDGEISPDGRWIAYASNESGRLETYVRPFPDVASGRWQISTSGGRTPLWSRNGQELFFRSPDGTVMGARVDKGTSWRSTTPERILAGQYFFETVALGRTFDISPDGRRFLMIKEGRADTALQNRIVFVQHWTEELKRLVPAN
jgi:serine/threonine-protein kinase